MTHDTQHVSCTPHPLFTYHYFQNHLVRDLHAYRSDSAEIGNSFFDILLYDAVVG